jgi:Ca-activated chloride channel homolog
MLVLDASGSMNAQIGGKTKMQIAREVVNGLVDGWPQATQLGMIAYGHW